MPDALPDCEKVFVVPKVPGAAGSRKKCVAGLEAVPMRWMVAWEITPRSTFTNGTAAEMSTPSARP